MADSTRDGAAGLPATLEVVTGWGKGSRVTGESEVKDAVTAFLAGLGSPFEAPSDNPGRLEAKRTAVGEWLGSLGPVVQRVCDADEQAIGGEQLPQGACTEAQLGAMTVKQLRQMAKEHQRTPDGRLRTKGFSAANKAALVAMLLDL